MFADPILLPEPFSVCFGDDLMIFYLLKHAFVGFYKGFKVHKNAHTLLKIGYYSVYE